MLKTRKNSFQKVPFFEVQQETEMKTITDRKSQNKIANVLFVYNVRMKEGIVTSRSNKIKMFMKI